MRARISPRSVSLHMLWFCKLGNKRAGKGGHGHINLRNCVCMCVGVYLHSKSLTEVYLICSKLYMFKPYNSISFDPCLSAWNTTIKIVNTSITSSSFLVPLCNSSLFSLPPLIPDNCWSPFCHHGLVVLSRVLYKWIIPDVLFFWLSSVTRHNFLRFIHVITCLFLYRTKWCSIYESATIYLLIYRWTWRLFPVWSYYK